MEISLDRLTICGNINKFKSLEGFYSRCEQVLYKNFAKYPYRTSIHFLDGSVLQVAERDAVNTGKIKELRYDFNPNNKDYEKLHMQVLGLMSDSHPTRIDVAFDVYDLDMSNFRWFDTKGRPFNVYYSGTGAVETWYIGGKTSELKIRIYNKAKEQNQKDKIWWRVEVQLRGDWAKFISEYNGQLMYNPFNDVFPVLEGEFKHLDVKDRAMIKFLLGEPSAFNELSNKTRAKYRKLMKEEQPSEIIDFAELWSKKYSHVAGELQSWLTFSRQL